MNEFEKPQLVGVTRWVHDDSEGFRCDKHKPIESRGKRLENIRRDTSGGADEAESPFNDSYRGKLSIDLWRSMLWRGLVHSRSAAPHCVAGYRVRSQQRTFHHCRDGLINNGSGPARRKWTCRIDKASYVSGVLQWVEVIVDGRETTTHLISYVLIVNPGRNAFVMARI